MGGGSKSRADRLMVFRRAECGLGLGAGGWESRGRFEGVGGDGGSNVDIERSGSSETHGQVQIRQRSDGDGRREEGHCGRWAFGGDAERAKKAGRANWNGRINELNLDEVYGQTIGGCWAEGRCRRSDKTGCHTLGV